MKIELFENVYLNKNMNIVIDNMIKDTNTGKTAFETYIADYRIEEIETETGSGDSYENYYIDMPTGQIVLDDYTLNASFNIVKDYSHVNYLSFSRYDEVVRPISSNQIVVYNNYVFDYDYLPFKVYAFVDSIKIQNHVLIANYTIDYMHTFMKLIRNFSGHLIRFSKDRIYKSTLPFSSTSPTYSLLTLSEEIELNGSKKKLYHTSNTTSTFSNLTYSGNPVSIAETTYSYLLMITIQFYDLNSSGERTDREVYNLVADSRDQNGTHISYMLNGILLCLNDLYLKQGTLQINSKYYEITNVYFFPRYFFKNTTITTIETLPASSIIFSRVLMGTNQLYFFNLNDLVGSDFTIEMRQMSIPINNKIESYGILTRMYKYKFNNQYKYIDFDFTLTRQDFSLLMIIENDIINITKDFEYEFPISVQNASSLQLQKISRKITNSNISLNQEQTAMNGIFSALSNIGGGIAGAATNNPLAAIGGIMGTLQAVGNTSIDLAKLDNQRVLNNAKVFNSNSSKNVSNYDNLFNLLYGIVYIEKDNIINQDIYNNSIKDNGYIVDSKMNFLNLLAMHTTNATITIGRLNYIEFVKYSNVILSGLFDNDINAMITATFSTGFKLINFNNLNTFKQAIINHAAI